MNYRDAFPSKWLSAKDLEAGREYTVTIDQIVTSTEEDRLDGKLICWFRGAAKGLPLNVTNCSSIAEILGSEETDDWAGKKITLYKARVQGPNGLTDGIRVRPSAGAVGGGKLPPKDDPLAGAVDEPGTDEPPLPSDEDNIPF